MDAPTPLPKEQLLLKLLKMTTSSNDGEALTAIRKANDVLKTASWDWDMLIGAKIVVIADPFSNLAAPPTSTRHAPSYAASPPPPASPAPNTQSTWRGPRTPPPPPPQPDPRGTPGNPLGSRPNLFVGFCHCCGIEVVSKAGWIFQSHGAPDWKVVCATCNTTATAYRHAATKVRVKRKRSIADLA